MLIISFYPSCLQQVCEAVEDTFSGIKLDCMLPHLRAIIVQNWRSNCCMCARIFLLSHCVKVFTEKLLQSSIEIRDTFSITYFTTTSTHIVPCAGLVSAFKLTMCSFTAQNGIFFPFELFQMKVNVQNKFLHCLRDTSLFR